MDSDHYLKILVSVSPQDHDFFVALCWELGTVGLMECRENADRLEVYFEPDEGALPEELRRRAADEGLRLVILDQAVIQSRPDDWLAGFREGFRGFPVGRGLWIHPPWEGPSQQRAVNLCVEPGAAFGTGTHESTQLCLEAMEEIDPPASVLDVGTGSGILTVAARKLWPGVQSIAIDNDPAAAAVARSTFRANRIEGILLAAASPQSLRGTADLVIANLTRPILQAHASDLVRLCNRELLVSGFTEEEEEAVLAAFEQICPWRHVFKRRLRSWGSYRMVRRRDECVG